MNRERMFPTKSRLQVAICLEKLANAERLAWLCLAALSGQPWGEETSLLLSLYLLCHTRLFGLIRPCLYPQLAFFYCAKSRPGGVNMRLELAEIRGWRRRYPNLLTPKMEEK